MLTDTKRIGFCCKWLDERGTTDDKTMNTRATTVAWLKRQTKAEAEQRLWDIMQHNTAATLNLVNRVGEMDGHLRMVRLGSDLLPVYTEPNFGYFHNDPAVKAFCERAFAEIGDVARRNDVRLSFHPGQFTVLASDNPNIVERSIEEFEYHTNMARWMGYGREFQDFKINVHIAGRLGHEGIRAAYQRLSPEARNCITIENEENAHGLDDCLMLRDILPIVLDVHHHWVREGEYISPSDHRVQMVEDSWRGVRPVLHYSVSREDYLPAHGRDVMPEMGILLESGHKKQKLRAHSDLMWNTAVNKYVGTFWDRFDIQVEAKAKNIASHALYREIISNQY
jgi:UV DNA damage repair endonuclease